MISWSRAFPWPVLYTVPKRDAGQSGKLSKQLCDCSHSTVVSTDDSLPVAIPQQFSGRVIRGRTSYGFKNHKVQEEL